MLVSELIKELQIEYSRDRSIVAQVVGQESGIWNCNFKITKRPNASSFVVLTLSHPKLVHLPSEMGLKVAIDTCDFGHKFAKLPDHPKNSDGYPRCPHCMADGLDLLKQIERT